MQVISSKLLKVHDHRHNHKRVFLSKEKNDNLIECIVSKVKIAHVDPNVSDIFIRHISYLMLIMLSCYR